MKSKVAGTIISVGLAMVLTGCSLADIREEQGNDMPDTVDVTAIANPSEVNRPDGTDVPDTQPPEAGPETENSVYDGLAYSLYCDKYDDIFIVDAFDRQIDSYSVSEFINNKNLKDENVDDAVFAGYSKGIYYFLDGNYSEDNAFSTLYAVDAATDEVAVVCHYSSNEKITAVDLYQDSVYVTFYSMKGKEVKYFEDVYTKMADSFEYDVEEGAQSSFINKQKVSAIYTNSTNSAGHDRRSHSVQRTIDNYGLIIAEAAGKYEKISSGGAIQIFDIPYTGIDIVGYDSRYIALTAYNEEYFGQYIYCYDMAVDAYYTVGNADATLLGYVNGMVYYAEDESEEYGIVNNHFYKFDPETGMSTELYDLYEIPGSGIDNPGVEGFCYIEDHALFLDYMGGYVSWVAVYYDECGATYKYLGCQVAEAKTLEYGSVSRSVIIKDCPFCMAVLLNYYSETYQVSEEYAPGYEKINLYLKQLELGNYDTYISNIYDVEDSSKCEYHSGMLLTAYQNIEVADVDIISQKYLTVNYEKEGFSGGAHGTFTSQQYMFELATGEYVGIADLYKGDETEFKTFIAEKTRDDYLSYKEESPYYDMASGAEGIYNTAYEAAGFDTTDIEFYEDKAVIVYHEYEMGPYASGEIRIDVSYKELLGRSKL